MSVRNGFLIAAAVGIALVACATNRPTAEITHARTLLDQAEQNGAQRYAAADLDEARNKLQQAESLAEKGNHDQALFRANEAAADAELATARTQAGVAKHAADEVQKSNETLRQEATREEQMTPKPMPAPASPPGSP